MFVIGMVVNMWHRLSLIRPLGAKQAIRDVFKRYSVPEYELTNITKKSVSEIR